ncbi:hypothetical protein D917_00475, partial [Trichinella nativa]
LLGFVLCFDNDLCRIFSFNLGIARTRSLVTFHVTGHVWLSITENFTAGFVKRFLVVGDAEMHHFPRRTEIKCCNRGSCYLQSARCGCTQLLWQLFISRPRADGDRSGALRFSFTLWLVQYCSNVASNSSSRHCGCDSTICSLSHQEKEVRGRRDGGKGFVNWCIFICSSAALSAWRSIALDAGRHGVGRGGKFLDFCKNFTRPEMWTSVRGLVTPVGATPIDSKDQFE